MAGLTWTLRLMIYFLLSDGTLGRTSPPMRPQITPQSVSQKESELKMKDETTINKASTDPAHNEHRLASAYQLVQDISASLHGQIDLHSNTSCTELAAGPWGGKGFSQELLGLAMVPVLVSAGCWREAQALVVNLYSVLGQNDTHQFLQDILTMIQRAKEREPTHSHQTVKDEKQAPPPVLNPVAHRHLQAVVFNIEQLAQMGVTNSSCKSKMEHRRHCKGWVRVTGTQLLGQSNGRDGLSSLEEAQRVCRNLGVKCAGVTHSSSGPGSYHAILRPGSRAAPSSSHDSWIRNCNRRSVRWGRNAAPRHHCVNESEERVYTVVEWIPAVSTLYNLGTAVYYASVNCYDTAKERAILSTVDLGTDALMAVTGGTAGVAGYALGAGLKTGVKAGIKYLLNTMKEEDDLLMNQNSWEDGTLTIQ